MELKVPIFKNWRTTFEKVEKFISNDYFTEINLISKINLESIKLTKIYHLNSVTKAEKSSKDNHILKCKNVLSFDSVKSCSEEIWSLVDSNSFIFGPTWSNHWFRVNLEVSNDWISKENCLIQIHWNCNCEVLVYSAAGVVVTGLNSNYNRTEINVHDLTDKLEAGKSVSVYLQASCNHLFGAGASGLISPPDNNKTYKIDKAELVLVSKFALHLSWDLQILLDIAQSLKETDRGYQALFVANQAVNWFIEESFNHNQNVKEDSIEDKIKNLINQFFQTPNGSSQIQLACIGHCHIDTAWLWRFVESRHKTARSWSSTLNLMEKHPQMTFVCSQTQQFQWLLEDHPELFKKIQNRASEGRFIPVGGTWVEMDVNMPCFESLVRQFLYGQQFVKKHFGHYCTEFWLPDTFGYCPQLPQIMQMAGITKFVTQKLSWSLVNKFPHHTFIWQGLDESKVLTHFPPGDSYSMNGKIDEVIKSAANCMDKGRTSQLMYLYGYGDGGQGPTNEMLHFIDRIKDCDGIPRMEYSTPTNLFDSINPQNLCTWRGELFLELHNGTYTSQRQIKQLNAHCESMLRLVEMLISYHMVEEKCCVGDNSSQDLSDQLEEQWKKVLLCQFHDVLPGSCIFDVAEDAYWILNSVMDWCRDFVGNLGHSLLNVNKNTTLLFNPTCWPIKIPYENDIRQLDALSWSTLPTSIGQVAHKCVMHQNEKDKLITISNQYFTMDIDYFCNITRLTLKSLQNISNLLATNKVGNELYLYNDVPLFWDAWDIMDYHQESGVKMSNLIQEENQSNKPSITSDDCSITLSVMMVSKKTGTVLKKSITIYDQIEYIKLNVEVMDWKEQHKLLKVSIPIKANPTHIAYHTQGGWHTRPNHRNTSWDSAQYEVCSHRWIDVAESNWGVAILKDSIFGSSAVDGHVFLSLLRSPTSPDADCDKTHLPHIFSYGIYPYNLLEHPGNHYGNITRLAEQFHWIAVTESRMESTPLQSNVIGSVTKISQSFPLQIVLPLNGQVNLDWMKLNYETGYGRLVVRIHEQNGGSYRAVIKSGRSIKCVLSCNIMEEIIDDEMSNDLELVFNNDGFQLTLSPFKVASIIVEFN